MYHWWCCFAVRVGDKFVDKQKRGDRGPALSYRVRNWRWPWPALVHWNVLISLTLAPLVKTQLKSEFLPILLRVNAYQFCIPFCFSGEQNQTNRVDWVQLGSVIELTKKVPVRLCSIAEPIELQSKDWVRLGSIGFWFGFVRLTTPGIMQLPSTAVHAVHMSIYLCCRWFHGSKIPPYLFHPWYRGKWYSAKIKGNWLSSDLEKYVNSFPL